jgi:glutathione S-transferase
LGEIPVLEEDGVRLTQTAPVLLQLAERYGRFGGTSAQKFEILRWLFWDNHKLTGYMATYRYLRTFTAQPDAQVLAFLRKRIDDYLSILDGHLQPRAFVVGDEPTVADISLMAYLHYPSDEQDMCSRAVSRECTPGWVAWRSCQAGARLMICCRVNVSCTTRDFSFRARLAIPASASFDRTPPRRIDLSARFRITRRSM